MVTLSEKLIKLGVRKGARDLPPPRPRSPWTIDRVVEGRLLANEAGDAFVVETTYPREYRHGRVELAITNPLRTIAEWARDERLAGIEPEQFVFLDTETTGLAGGTGTLAFLIGIGRFVADGFRLTQYFLRDPIEEPAVLTALLGHLDGRGGLVTFNGRSFDVPLLMARYTLNGHRVKLGSMAHLDLLPLVRRLWRDRLESRALGFLEQHILGARRTEADVPGWEIPQLYFEYLRTGDARPLKGVFYHNAMDVLTMAGLLNRVSTMLEQPLTFEFEHGVDLYAIGKLFEELGRIGEAGQLYARALEFDLSEDHFRQVRHRLSMSHKRLGHLDAALELWREGAERGEIYAHVELAKYCEHRVRDYSGALDWTRAAMAFVCASDALLGLRRTWQSDLERRLRRLEFKTRATQSD